MTRPSEIQFPAIESADADGLLMLGGELNNAWLLAAYARGIFPWPLADAAALPPAWWCPDPRAVLEFAQFHVSRSLQRTIRSRRFEVTFDRDFSGVIRGCAEPRRDGGGAWLTDDLQDAFLELYRLGHAHSIEVWRNGQLAGGVYGLAMGGYFSAESMFHRQRDASKVALVHLMRRLSLQQFTLVDIQVLTEHTQRMGATEIPRDEFLRRLREALKLSVQFSSSISPPE